MPVIQRAPQGRMRSGGTPAWEPPGRTGRALGAAGDPAAAVRLRDGSTVQLRRVRAEDAAAVRCLFPGAVGDLEVAADLHGLSPPGRVVDWATKVEDDRRLGLVAITANTGQVIAHAGLERDPGQPDRAEFAVVIATSAPAPSGSNARRDQDLGAVRTDRRRRRRG